MENDGIAIGAKIACNCDRWPERLLQQGCLHDRCHRCDATTFQTIGSDNHYTGSRSSWTTTAMCTVCDEAMKQSADDSNDKKMAEENPFYMSTAIVPRTSEGLLACECCIDHSTALPQRAAAYFCKDCHESFLCDECKQSHDKLFGEKHNIMPFDENEAQTLPVDPLARISAVHCRLHDSPCDRWCSKCNTAKCQECALQCAKEFHSIWSSNEMDLNRWVDHLNSSTFDIEQTCAQLRHVESALELEHKADMLELKERKQCIQDALYSAFDSAFEALESSFRETRQRIANFRYCVDSAVKCSRLLTRQPLPSHSILIQCAQSTFECHKNTAQRLLAREEVALARLGSTTLSGNLADVVKSWIGLPVLRPVAEPNKIAQSTVFADNLLRNQQQIKWYDIAVTLCGHVLVANGKSGLQELDSTGFPLATWLPASASVSPDKCNLLTDNSGTVLEAVVSVDCLEDDRAVVGLQNDCAVVLLQREDNGDSLEWREQKRFDLEQEAPFAVAAWHNLLVVALGSVSNDSQIILPGKHLAAFDVNTGIRQASAELDFEIDSVAIANLKNTVIVASNYRVNVTLACNGQFVIESRSSDLQSCLWRVSRDYPILGLATSTSRAEVYASVSRERGRRVITLDVDTGLPTNVAVVDTAANVWNGITGVRSMELKSCNEVRHSHDAETGNTATKIPGAFGRNNISTDDGMQAAPWLTSNTVFGKLSCSKSKASHLVALGFGSKMVCHLSVYVVKPSLKDSLRRVMQFIKAVFTIGDCLVQALFPASTVVVLMLLLYLLPLNRMQGNGFDSNSLICVFLSVCGVLSSKAFKKLLRIKSLTSNLLKLRFDSTPLFNLPTDFELTSLIDYARHELFFRTKDLFSFVEFLPEVLLNVFAFAAMMLNLCLSSLNDPTACCIDCDRVKGYFGYFFGQDFLRAVEAYFKE